MKMPSWDRIYFFVFMATVFSAVSYVSMLVLPLVELQDLESGEVVAVTLLAVGSHVRRREGYSPAKASAELSSGRGGGKRSRNRR